MHGWRAAADEPWAAPGATTGRLYRPRRGSVRFDALVHGGAVNASTGQGAPALSGTIGSTPRDSKVRTATDARGLAVHEHALLEVLPSDLSGHGPSGC